MLIIKTSSVEKVSDWWPKFKDIGDQELSDDLEILKEQVKFNINNHIKERLGKLKDKRDVIKKQMFDFGRHYLKSIDFSEDTSLGDVVYDFNKQLENFVSRNHWR